MYSETMTVSPFLTLMMSVSFLCISLRLRGLFLTTTEILGCSSGFMRGQIIVLNGMVTNSNRAIDGMSLRRYTDWRYE